MAGGREGGWEQSALMYLLRACFKALSMRMDDVSMAASSSLCSGGVVRPLQSSGGLSRSLRLRRLRDGIG